MPVDPERRSRLRRALDALRRQANTPSDGDRLRLRIQRKADPPRLSRLERLADDLDRLEARYGYRPEDKEPPAR